MKTEEIAKSYGYLFEQELIEEIASVSKTVEVREGDMLMDVGQVVSNIPFVVEWSNKDFKVGQSRGGDSPVFLGIRRCLHHDHDLLYGE